MNVADPDDWYQDVHAELHHRCASAAWVQEPTGAVLLLFEANDFETVAQAGYRARRRAYWWAVNHAGRWTAQDAGYRIPPPPFEWAGEWVRWMAEASG